MSPKGIFAVFTEPGPNVDEAEYHDWYDNEHIPLRVPIPTFLSATRWEAVDGQTPKFLATYDMDSPEGTKHPGYAGLFATQSDREKRIFKDMSVIDRRIYAEYEGASFAPSALYDPKKPGAFLSWIEVEPTNEEEVNKWYDEEHIGLLSKVPGWIRSRRFVLKEAGQLGANADPQAKAPKFVAIHEWASADVVNTPEMKAALDTPLTKKVFSENKHERRILRQLRNWEKD